jgi:hypothetical protein
MSNTGLDNLLIIVLGLMATAGYFLPTLVAFYRGHEYRFVILAINLIAAWTILAWVGMLVWAVWPAEKSLADPVLGNPTGKGYRNVGDTLGAVDYGRQRGYDEERKRTPTGPVI